MILGGAFMKEKWDVAWSDKFLSGNSEIDVYHKEIIDGVVELYKLLEDSSKNKDEICELTNKVELAMFQHMDLEIESLKKYNILDWQKHDASHDFYKKEFKMYSGYPIPNVIRAVLIGEIARDYMRMHFFEFDIIDMPKISEKLNG